MVITRYILIVVLGLCTLSCRKDRDFLTDKWKLETITVKENQGKEEQAEWEYKADSIYFNFQTNVFLYQRMCPTGSYYTRYGYYEVRGDSISIVRLSSVKPYEKSLLLWTDSIKTFRLQKYGRRKMELEDENLIYKLRVF